MRPTHENVIIATGRIQTDLRLERADDGLHYYHGTIIIDRKSGAVDYLPISIPQCLLSDEDPLAVCRGKIKVAGELRSANRAHNGTHRHMVQILARRIAPTTHEEGQEVRLEGVICQVPKYRKTPFGREIADLMIAVDRAKGASYIPVITWGDTARAMRNANVGDVVRLNGRFQSRKYCKTLATGDKVERTAWEVSAKSCDVVERRRRLIAQ